MAWSIVNVILKDEKAIHGGDGISQSLVRQIIAEGYEPFSTAGVPGVGLVVSFRMVTEEPDFRASPGQYL